MRDTYADTSLARTRSRVRPEGVARRGSRSGVSMAFDVARARMTPCAHRRLQPERLCYDPTLVSSPAVRSARARAAGVRVPRVAMAAGCSSAAKKPPVGTPEPDKFLFDRGTEQLNAKHWLDGARVLPAARRQLSAEPVPRRRQARRRRHLPRRALAESLVLAQRVPGVPDVLPDARARRLRAVQAGDGALLPDAQRRSAIRPRRARRSRS